MIRKSMLHLLVSVISLGLTTHAFGQNGVSTFQFPLVFNTGMIECVGESLTAELAITVRTHLVVSPSGHTHHINNWNIEGVATGDFSGDAWFVHGFSPLVANADDDQFSNAILVQIILEPLDGGRKLKSNQRIQVMVDANGVLRVFHAEFPQYRCTGNA